MPYRVVEDFEEAISEYTGAPEVVTTNSGSMALTIALAYCKPLQVIVPKRTYCSVPNAVINAGAKPMFEDIAWSGEYQLHPTNVWDSARCFTAGMFRPGQMQCVSFQTSKILGLEQGGAVLLDDPEAALWLRRARFDGRLDASEKLPRQRGFHCYLNPSTAALGLSRLACLQRDNPPQCGHEFFKDLSELGFW